MFITKYNNNIMSDTETNFQSESEDSGSVSFIIPEGTTRINNDFVRREEYHALVTSFHNRNIYFIHDNGGKPFKIVIDNGKVTVWKFNLQRALEEASDLHPEQTEMYDEIISEWIPEQIFIGESPETEQTRYSGGYGEFFKGNSFILKMSEQEYIHIGRQIFKFTTDSQIITFVSPVGNSDVPYPYAIDEDGYYYLMLEKIKIRISEDRNEDPYNHYYNRRQIVSAYNHGRMPVYNFDIDKFYIGEDQYDLTWTSRPEQNFQRLKDNISHGNEIKVIYKDGRHEILDVDKYKNIMDRFNIMLQAYEFENVQVMYERVW